MLLIWPINDCVTTIVPNVHTLDMTLGNATLHIRLDSSRILPFKSPSSTSSSCRSNVACIPFPSSMTVV
ncbi:hypothetical protein Hanom_Chr06g00488671 [Helianthus anomalus]